MEESQNHGWLAAVHPDDVSWVRGIYFEALKLGSSMTSSFRVRHHSGEYRWCLSKMLPLQNPDGSVREWIGAIEDVNQRRLAEERSQLEEERRGLALEAARMVAWDYDTASREVFRSENAPEILGTGSGRADDVESWIHPDDVERVLAALRRTEETGEPYEVEYRLKDRDGRARWVRGRGKLLRNVKNGPNRVVGITFDVTANKEAERQYVQLTEKLSLVEARYAALAAIAGDFLWMASTDGKLVASSEWGAFTGQSLQEMSGWGWLNAVHPADRERTREVLHHQASSNRIASAQYRLRNANGDYVWVNSRAAARSGARRRGSTMDWRLPASLAGFVARADHRSGPFGLLPGADQRSSSARITWAFELVGSRARVSIRCLRFHNQAH